ncbi:MAG: hypothetical protein QOG28_3017, partial [Trebonia sp.]|nr:hypothetical protein [Trebonia sp.]
MHGTVRMGNARLGRDGRMRQDVAGTWTGRTGPRARSAGVNGARVKGAGANRAGVKGAGVNRAARLSR